MKSKEPLIKTVALRFSDNFAPDEGTISVHRNLIKENGYVWYGKLGAAVSNKVQREKVCNLEIWAECFGREPANIRKQDSYEINAIMAKLEGWKRYDGNKSGKLSFKDYGSQVAYVRLEIVNDDEALPFC